MSNCGHTSLAAHPKRRIPHLAAALLLAGGLARGGECVKWIKRTDVGSYGQRMHHAMAYDSDRGVTVFFGGEIGKEGEQTYFDDTQEYNGTNWVRINVSGAKPPTRSLHAMAYDPVRKQVLLYGGHRADGPAFGDAWLYTSDGVNGTWRQVADFNTVVGHAMVWNPVRQRVMSQGGVDRIFNPGGGFTFFGGPYEWTGQFWDATTVTDPHEYGLAMAWDSSRNVALAYGGYGGLNEEFLSDSFQEYNSQTGWADRGSGPPQRAYAAMAYDERRQRVVLVGGVGDSPEVGEEAYEFIPERGFWFNLPPLPAGQGRAGAKMVYDARRGVMVLTGGAGGGAPNASQGGRYSDTWELVPGLSVTNQPASATNDVCGEARFSVGVEGVSPFLYSWRLDGRALVDGEHFSGVAGPVLTVHGLRHEHTGNYDVVVRDSCGAQNISAQNVVTSKVATLTIQPGAQWVLRSTNGPPIRFGHSMVYDSARRVTVLFGGQTNWNGTFPFNDLWEWDGARWTQRQPATRTNGWTFAPNLGWRVSHTDRPVQRAHHAMAYDSRRGRVVVFGGHALDPGGSTPVLKDLWEWDGTQWHFRATNGPIERLYPKMSYDERRGRMVVFGGQPVGVGPPDGELVWEWDGDRWHTNRPAPNPSNNSWRNYAGMTYDNFRGVVVFGPSYESYSQWAFWDWDGVKWTINAPIVYLTDPVVATMNGTIWGGFAFDANRRRSIWFGGAQIGPQNRTAFFDGKQWTLLTNSATPPAGRLLPAMAYDSDRRVTVMFGGSLVTSGVLGATNDTWELIAVDVPLINEHPASQYRQPGEKATFRVQAVESAGGTLRYRWYFGGEILAQDPAVRITGLGTPTLEIQNVSARDAGTYSVRVSNDCGETRSHSAVLTLDPKLQIFSVANTTTLIWPPAPNLVLESADRVTGPWTVIPNATSPFAISASGPAKFFRLRQVE